MVLLIFLVCVVQTLANTGIQIFYPSTAELDAQQHQEACLRQMALPTGCPSAFGAACAPLAGCGAHCEVLGDNPNWSLVCW